MSGEQPTRWRIDLEYDGSAFVGWQLQPRGRTVQGVVEEALARILGHPVRVQAAGRTDTGVHAEQQVVAFNTPVQRDARAMVRGLNGNLPEDVACLAAEQVPLAFDPRRAPHTKRYRYRWLDRDVRSPLRRHRAWHVTRPLDAERMHEAVQALVGQHDFTTFRATGCSAAHPIRTLERAAVERIGDEVHLIVEGTGFLRHMIRIVAGSLTEIGQGRRPPGWMGDILAARDRRQAARTAPAHGLTLDWIRYQSSSSSALPSSSSSSAISASSSSASSSMRPRSSSSSVLGASSSSS